MPSSLLDVRILDDQAVVYDPDTGEIAHVFLSPAGG
jgi:hypothetical protein